MEKKMRKLQKKYQQVTSSNLEAQEMEEFENQRLHSNLDTTLSPQIMKRSEIGEDSQQTGRSDDLKDIMVDFDQKRISNHSQQYHPQNLNVPSSTCSNINTLKNTQRFVKNAESTMKKEKEDFGGQYPSVCQSQQMTNRLAFNNSALSPTDMSQKFEHFNT